MSVVGRVLLVAASLVLCGPVAAQTPQSTPAPAAAVPNEAEPAATEPVPVKPASEAKPPDAPVAGKPSPQHFEPTEKVRPDFDVSFPVDI